MPFAEEFMLQGTFTVPATLPATVNVNCGFLPTKIQIRDTTLYGNRTNGFFNLQDAWWESTTPINTYGTFSNGAAAAPLQPFLVTTGSVLPPPPGISLFNGQAASPTQLVLGPAIAGTTIVKATGVFTVASTATLSIGSIIQISNNAVYNQLGGLFAQVATIPSGTTFTIVNGTLGAAFINTANFAAGGETAFTVRLVTIPPLYYPQNLTVVAVTAANPMVVSFSRAHNLTVGQQVRLTGFTTKTGMVQANNLIGQITAVTQTATISSITLNIDASAFSAFLFPGSAVNAALGIPFTPPTVVPIGQGPTASPVPYLNFNPYNSDLLDDATTNQSFQGFTVGTGLLAQATAAIIGVNSGDLISWTAWRASI